MGNHRETDLEQPVVRGASRSWRRPVLGLGLAVVLIVLLVVVARTGGTGRPVAVAATAAIETCVSVPVAVPAGRFPVEGVPDATAVRLYGTSTDGSADLLVPETYVLRSTTTPEGSLNMSVLLRSGAGAGDEAVAAVMGASATASLSVGALYDLDALQILDACRSAQP